MLKPQDQQKYQAGLRHFEAGNLGSAENRLRAVAQANPRFAEAQFNLGLILRARRKFAPAAHCFRAAIRIAPELAEAHGALAAVLQNTGDEAAAEEHARTAVSLRPSLVFARILLGDLLRAQGRLRDARQVYDALLQAAPDQPEARFGRAFLNLLEGELAAGWADYEFRPARRGSTPPPLQPDWRGEALGGRTLLLYAEQGLGDTIQFLRFVPRLAEQGAKVLLALPTPLMELAAGLEGVHEIVRPSIELPRFDFSCALASLPLRLGATLETIPLRSGYLAAGAERVAAWRERLGTSPKLSVAIAWAGNPDHPNDHNRSMTPDDIAPLFQIPGVRWLNLQTRPDAKALRRHRQAEILDLGQELSDFSDTAAILSAADLVLSVDTALCHLAGALGRPVWTMLPFAPDWRWLTERADSPWYGSMRLIRQPAPRAWGPVIAEVAGAIRARASVED
jgi:tetratricopeptide (TPR) repeat protein